VALRQTADSSTSLRSGRNDNKRGRALGGQLGEDFGEVFGSGAGVLGDLFAAAEAVADDDGFGVVADGGEEDALS